MPKSENEAFALIRRVQIFGKDLISNRKRVATAVPTFENVRSKFLKFECFFSFGEKILENVLVLMEDVWIS